MKPEKPENQPVGGQVRPIRWTSRPNTAAKPVAPPVDPPVMANPVEPPKDAAESEISKAADGQSPTAQAPDVASEEPATLWATETHTDLSNGPTAGFERSAEPKQKVPKAERRVLHVGSGTLQPGKL